MIYRTVAIVSLCLATSGVNAQATKLDLTPGRFESLHTLIRPHDNEWRHLKVNWINRCRCRPQEGGRGG